MELLTELSEVRPHFHNAISIVTSARSGSRPDEDPHKVETCSCMIYFINLCLIICLFLILFNATSSRD